MADQPAQPPKQPSAADRLMTYAITIVIRAIPMFGIIIIAYSWRVALVWAVMLSVFYDRLNERE